MSSRPFLHYLDDLAQINGEPRVTFPDSLSYPVTERVHVLPIKATIPAFGDAEPDATNYPNNKLVDISLYGHDRHKKKVYVRYEVVPGYSKVTPFIDDETLTAGTITRQLVVKPSFPLTQTPGSLVSYQPLNDYCGYLTTQTLTDFASAGRTIENPESFTFPRRIYGVTEGLLTALDGTAKTFRFWDEIAEFTALTPVQLIVSYGTRAALATASPAIEYAPIFRSLDYDGVIMADVKKGAALNDALTVGPYNTSTENPTWGYVAELARTFPATSPSASGYDLLKNAYRVVAVHLEPWKYNLWRLTVKKVYLR